MVEDAFLRKYQPAPGHCRGHTHFGIRPLGARAEERKSGADDGSFVGDETVEGVKTVRNGSEDGSCDML